MLFLFLNYNSEGLACLQNRFCSKKTMQKLLKIIFGLLVLACLHCQSSAQSLEQKMDDYIQTYVGSNNFSGVILVKQKDKTIYQKAFGYANLEHQIPNQINTVFQIASVSKPFTAAAILWLEERGKLSTGDLLSKYIPDYPNGDKITIHHLLTHTSGIQNINNFAEYDTISRLPQTPEALVNVFKNRPLDFEPGARYSYSNSNYNLLAYIVETVSGKSFGDFLKTTFFEPLGMNDTRHRADVKQIVPRFATGYEAKGGSDLQQAVYTDWSAKTGNGSLYATVEDLYKWDRALHTDKILSKASRDKIFTNHISGAGYGWFVWDRYNKKRVYINGSSPGYTSYFLRFPDDDVCIIVLGNNYIGLATRIGNDLAAILFEQPYNAISLGNAKLSETEAQAWAGKYQFDANFFRPNQKMEFRVENGELVSTWGTALPIGGNRYILRQYWMECSFEKNDKGEPVLVISRSRAPRTGN